jgi:hypothetical protein
LIASVQLTVAVGVPVAAPTAAGGEYFCCCIGECHCTADCCNHAPAELPNNETTRVRIGAGGLALEAPRSCGTTQGTLQRPNNQNTTFTVDHRKGPRLLIDDCSARQESAEIPAFESHYFPQSNPRAPPLSASFA